jgi:HAD superfamily hydrolase (TIGR01509 family)
VRAVFFDFDGLILDTETPEVETWREVFREHGTEFPDAYWINALGRGADQITQTPAGLLAEKLGRPIDEAAVHQAARDRVLAKIDAAEPRPGILRLLGELKEAGIPMAVVSSSKHSWVDGYLGKLELSHFFEFTVCADDVERAKPFPDLYLAAMAKMGVDPSDSLALEDSPNGSHAGVSAGMTVFAIPNPVTARLDISHAHWIIEDLTQLSLATMQSRFESIVKG